MAIRNEILRRRIARVTMLAACGRRSARAWTCGGRRLKRVMADPHIGFIVAAYAVAAATIGAMIAYVVLDYRRLSAHLDEVTQALEAARRGAKDARAPMSADAETAPRPRRWLAFLPLAAFACLAALLFLRLSAGDPARIPSALIGQSAPPLTLPGLDGAAGLTDADLRMGHVSLVNVFGSWCEPCHFEHEYLMALAADPSLQAKGVAIYGVAQKDSPENVRRFLGAKGDPYAKVGLDADGRAGIDWGVYGVPETFIVRGDGSIAYKIIGPITAEALESEVKPQILKAMN